MSKPFYFMVSVWGERYTAYVIDWLIPSLLSPRNIPALEPGRHRFCIATPDEDFMRISFSASAGRLRQAGVVIEQFPIPSGPLNDEESPYRAMGVGHKLMTEAAFRAKAYGVLLSPDMVLSDGSVATAQAHAKDGALAVLVAALRFAKEPLMDQFAAAGKLPGEATFGARELVGMALQSHHSETLRYEWDSPAFTVFPSAVWFRVKGEKGIVVFSLSWNPLLIDYGAIAEHDSSVMDTWTIDGDYVYRNFGDDPRVHALTDSDDAMLVSWTPYSERTQSIKPHAWGPVEMENYRQLVVRNAFYSDKFEPLKRRLFFKPVFWHPGALTPAYDAQAMRSGRLLRECFLGRDNATAA